MSRKPEQLLNDRILHALRGFDPVRIETGELGRGTPDINFIDGWIESKVIAAWPKSPAGIVRVPHYTPQQRAWHMKRGSLRGQIWVVLQVGDQEHLVLHGLNAAEYLGSSTRDSLCHMAALHMETHWDGVQFRNFIHEGNRRQGMTYGKST